MADGEGRQTIYLAHIARTALTGDAGRTVAWTYVPAGVVLLGVLSLPASLFTALLHGAPGVVVMYRGIAGFNRLEIHSSSSTGVPAIVLRIGVPATDGALLAFRDTLDATVAALHPPT